jgi:hypothetical protein
VAAGLLIMAIIVARLGRKAGSLQAADGRRAVRGEPTAAPGARRAFLAGSIVMVWLLLAVALFAGARLTEHRRIAFERAIVQAAEDDYAAVAGDDGNQLRDRLRAWEP